MRHSYISIIYNNNIPLYCDSISYIDLEIYNTDSTFSKQLVMNFTGI